MKNIADYLFELGQLKLTQRSGWWVIKEDNPETVAEHSFRTAIIGFILGIMAGADPYRTSTICLFHDTEEARLNDLNNIATKYWKNSGGNAFLDMIGTLPKKLSRELKKVQYTKSETDSLEMDLAYDADMLECIIQAIEYKYYKSYKTDSWIENCISNLRHPVSKKIANECIEVNPDNWFKVLNRSKK